MPTPSAPGILFVSHTAQRTGAPIGLLAFMGWLRRHTDYRMGTLLGASGPLDEEFRQFGPVAALGNDFFTRTRVGRRVRRFLPRAVREEIGMIRRTFARGSYDLIYSSTITNGHALAALADFGVPVVTHVHELGYWIWRTGEKNIRHALDQTDAYIAVSRCVRDHLVQQLAVPPEKISVIYEHVRELPPVPTPEEKLAARRALGIPDGAFVIGACGAEPWRKGRDLVAPLLVALRRHDPLGSLPMHFVWVGRAGSSEEEYALRHDLRLAGVEAVFHATGELEQPQASFAAFDAFVLLSRDDPFPLVCLEVAAQDVPLVCFEGAGGMPEFVEDGGGVAVPYLDLEDMARVLIRWRDDAGLRRSQGQRAGLAARSEHSVEVTGPQILRVIHGVLPAASSTPLREMAVSQT